MRAPPKLEIYLSTSFIGDLGYEAPTDQVAGMAHTLVTGRKTWKTSKGKNEAVWPAHIEAALFDALEKYRPSSSGDPRLLRRFPKRNRFISDHIYKVTGKTRTPKQVGSRLQQLRDTCQEPKVLALLSRREFPPDIQTQSLVLRRSESPTPSLSSAATTPASSPFAAEFPDMFFRTCNLMSPMESAGILPGTVSDISTPIVDIDVVSQLPPSDPTVVKPPAFNPVEYTFQSADPHMGPNVPVYAPRPLLLQDTVNTLLSVPGQPDLCYDSCGGMMAVPVPTQEPAYDFLGVGDADPSYTVDANRNWVNPHSLYLNFQYNW